MNAVERHMYKWLLNKYAESEGLSEIGDLFQSDYEIEMDKLDSDYFDNLRDLAVEVFEEKDNEMTLDQKFESYTDETFKKCVLDVLFEMDTDFFLSHEEQEARSSCGSLEGAGLNDEFRARLDEYANDLIKLMKDGFTWAEAYDRVFG